LLKPLKQHLIDVTSFRLSKSLYSRSVPFKRTNNLGSVLPNRLDRRIYEIKFPTDVSFFFFFPFSVSRITLKSLSTLKTFLLFAIVAVLSIYHLLFTAEIVSRKKLYATKQNTVGILTPLGCNVAQIGS
jgi:hypothetical protein